MIKLPETEGLHEKARLGDPAGPGPRLRAAREACGYDIQDIAKQLRLHPHIIEDLERDQFSDHLALVFVRGYLRSYANLIGLDPDEVVAEFNALGYEEARDLPDLKNNSQSGSRMRNTQDMYKSRARSGLRWAAIAGVTIAVGGLFLAFSYQPQEVIYTSPIVTELSPLDAPNPGIDPNLPPAAVVESTDSAETVANPVATPAPAAPATLAPAAPAPRPVSRAPASAPPSEYEDEPELPKPDSDF